ncbi:hypothetical protein [Terrimonas alba]|uniref:hypothetical protein n=1 Tax=Terrimonas alba TaxID=3349636 RepID=UPI0035F45ED4
MRQINNSSALWPLLNDKSIPQDLRISLGNIRRATDKAGNMADNLHAINGCKKW